MKQKTIGLNPLEEYLTSAKATKEEPEETSARGNPSGHFRARDKAADYHSYFICCY